MPVNPYLDLDNELGDGSGNVEQYLPGGLNAHGAGVSGSTMMMTSGPGTRSRMSGIGARGRGIVGQDPLNKVDALLKQDRSKMPVQTSLGTEDALGDAANTSANASAGKYVDPDQAYADRLAGVDRGPDKDAGYFARQARKVLTDGLWDVSNVTGIPVADAGANPDFVPTTSAVAKNGPKPLDEMHSGLDKEAQQHARGDRPDFTAYDRVSRLVEKKAEEIASGGVGSKILDFLKPVSMTNASQLHALMIQKDLLRDAAIERHQREHPELYAQPGAIHGYAPGTIITDAQGKILRTLPERPEKPEKPPKEQNKVFVNAKDKRWLEDPNTRMRTPVMEETPDMQGPTPSGAAGYTGEIQAGAADVGAAGTPMERQQAVIDAKKAAAIETKKTTPGKAAPKTPEEIKAEAEAREAGKLEAAGPAKEESATIKAARADWAKNPRKYKNLDEAIAAQTPELARGKWIQPPGGGPPVRIRPKSTTATAK